MVDAFQPCDEFGAFGFGAVGARRAFELTHRLVAVNAHH
jgi:hypothetical protein